MNTIVQKSFEGLEISLAALVESVSSYNPSPAAARAVVNADDILTRNLEQSGNFKVNEHQQGYQKILFLRAISKALDSRLTQLLESLSDARKDVLDVPMTNFPPSQEIPYDELLTYARKISKYTRPLQSSKYSQAPATDNAYVSPHASNSLGGINNGETARLLPLGLSEEDVSALDLSHIPFAPWPSEEAMKRGALSHTAYEEELHAQGLPVPGFLQNPDANGQKMDADTVSVQNTPVRVEAITVQPLRHERPKEHQPPPGLSLSLDLYDPDED